MLRVYRASAGAGKTFALTMEYFKIVFNVSSEYKNVLAVTFTNKATEEMKSRIVRELNKLAEGQKSDYREELKRTLKLTDDQWMYLSEMYDGGMTVTEIAAVHDVNKSTVSRSVNRAKKTLQDYLQFCL